MSKRIRMINEEMQNALVLASVGVPSSAAYVVATKIPSLVVKIFILYLIPSLRRKNCHTYVYRMGFMYL